MSSLSNRFRLLAVASLGLLFASLGQAQASRTWVSGVGDDANPCSRTAPCKTFAGAISKTAASGEIDCLDPGGFGAVTIVKSITLDCGAGTVGSILVASGQGITVNAQPTDVVTIRNLSIAGFTGGSSGIRFIGGLSLTIDNVHIYQFTSYGVEVSTATANAKLNLLNTVIGDNPNGVGTSSGLGILATGGGFTVNAVNSRFQRSTANCIVVSAPAKLTIKGSTISNCAVGVNLTVSNTGVVLDGNTISNNTTGLQTIAGAIAGITNNTFSYNTFGLNPNGGTIETETPASNSMVANFVDGTPNANKAKI